MGIFTQHVLAVQADHIQAGFDHVAVFALIVGQAEVLVDQMKNVVDAVKGVIDAEGILKNGLHIAAIDL